jgi:hypothetical protein
MRADPHKGYVNEFQVYIGKEGVAERGLGSVLSLFYQGQLLQNYHHIYFDNYLYLFSYLGIYLNNRPKHVELLKRSEKVCHAISCF